MTNQDENPTRQNQATAFSAGAQSVSNEDITENFRPPGSSVLHTFTSPDEASVGIRKKAVVTIAGVVLLIGGIGVGVTLTNKDQDIRRSAQVANQTREDQTTPHVSFGDIVLYDTQWNKLNKSDLSMLSAGDTIRIAVSGKADGGEVSMARFTINGKLYPETRMLAPSSQMYYYEFRVPENTSRFSVSAELYVEGKGWTK